MAKPLFQKRHYEAVAAQFSITENMSRIDRDYIAYRFVKLFKADNPKFNEDKFWRAIENPNSK